MNFCKVHYAPSLYKHEGDTKEHQVFSDEKLYSLYRFVL